MIRTVKFTIPANIQADFETFIHKKGLTASFTLLEDNMCEVEITYTRSQTSIIDEIEESLLVIAALGILGISAIALLSKQKTQDESISHRRSRRFRRFM